MNTHGLRYTIAGWLVEDQGLCVELYDEAVKIRDKGKPKPLPEYVSDYAKEGLVILQYKGIKKVWKYGIKRTREQALDLAETTIKKLVQADRKRRNSPG